MGENKEYITYSEESGSINISEEVVSTIAATAALETEGVAGLRGVQGNKKNIQRGVKIVKEEEDTIRIEMYITAKLGCAVKNVGTDVQKAVLSSVESMTGAKVSGVDVHIVGIGLEKDNK